MYGISETYMNNENQDENLDAINPSVEETTKEVIEPEIVEEKKEEETKVIPPSRAEGESDEHFQVRQQLKALKEAKDTASTEEEKSLLISAMKDLRKGLAETSKKSEPLKPAEDEDGEVDMEVVKDNLKKLGFQTQEEIQEIIKQTLENAKLEDATTKHQLAIKDFYSKNSDIYNTPEAKEFLENYVVETYKISATTSPEKIVEYMTDARNKFFPKTNNSKSRQEAANAVDLLNISGNSSVENSKYTAEDLEYAKQLKDKGWSEQAIKDYLG